MVTTKIETILKSAGENQRGEGSLMTNVENVSQYFFNTLLENFPEGVVFVDHSCTIRMWNTGARNLTGIGSAVVGRRLEPSLLKLKDIDRFPISDSANPFENWLTQGVVGQQKFFISGRSGRDAQVEVNFYPVRAKGNRMIGGIILFRDTSIQVELQRQLNDLYTIATVDPLTQVANRAEFERILGEYIQAHRAVGLHCSIVVCDIDFFKKINDKFGHHVGDQSLVRFASMLRQVTRPHDFIARFGGEEFVILCANCSEATAAQRAEEIRRVIETTPQNILDNKPMTASFGVAELLVDDDATSLFVRADHALLNAKSSGRNCVIQATTMSRSNGTEQKVSEEPVPKTQGKESDPLRSLPYRPILSKQYATSTILPLFIERIKNTALELKASVLTATENSLTMLVKSEDESSKTRHCLMFVDIDIAEIDKTSSIYLPNSDLNLLVRIALRPKKRLFAMGDQKGAAEVTLTKICQYLHLSSSDEVSQDSRYQNNAPT